MDEHSRLQLKTWTLKYLSCTEEDCAKIMKPHSIFSFSTSIHAVAWYHDVNCTIDRRHDNDHRSTLRMCHIRINVWSAINLRSTQNLTLHYKIRTFNFTLSLMHPKHRKLTRTQTANLFPVFSFSMEITSLTLLIGNLVPNNDPHYQILLKLTTYFRNSIFSMTS